MSDGLSALFKKKEKKAKKKVDVNLVGEALQARIREQEMAARMEEVQRVLEEDEYIRKAVHEDDWIDDDEFDDYTDIGLKYMHVDGPDEETHTAIEQVGEDKHHGGWGSKNKEEKKESDDNEKKESDDNEKKESGDEEPKEEPTAPAIEEPAAVKPSAYVPVHMRGASSAGALPSASSAFPLELKNEELFPTLDAAAEVPKKQDEEDDTKGWKTVTRAHEPAKYVPIHQRAQKQAAVEEKLDEFDGPKMEFTLVAGRGSKKKKIIANAKDIDRKLSEAISTAPPLATVEPTPAEPEPAKKSAYVPPALRVNKTEGKLAVPTRAPPAVHPEPESKSDKGAVELKKTGLNIDVTAVASNPMSKSGEVAAGSEKPKTAYVAPHLRK